MISVLCVFFISHRYESQVDPVEKDIQTIKKIVGIFENKFEDYGIDIEMVNELIAKIEEHNKGTKYIIVFDIQNNTNPILSTSIHFPVKKDFFDSVEIGDKIAEEKINAIENLIPFEKIGNWTIAIKDKKIRE